MKLWSVSLPLSRWLSLNVVHYDVVHIHGLFGFVPAAAAYHARRHRVPYIISPHGMLERWCLATRRAAVKRLSLKAVDGPFLRDAARVHFTCASELEQARDIGFNFNPVVIPLGINAEEMAQLADRPAPQANRPPTILFLGRIDTKKGLDVLIEAFAGV